MGQAQTPQQTVWRSLRLSTGLSLREIGRRTGINSGRLSIIERGVPPTAEEEVKLRTVLGGLVLG